MATPGAPPIPHVGGPISLGCMTVLIGGQPAARMGDMAICTGPPDAIALGSTIVLIGGQPAARMGDMSLHGGAIAVGLPTVLIGDAGSAQADALKKAAASGAPFAEVCP
ncbi:MAG TPA: PAAR domain-containing protein [Polyangiaceae bacterium]|nr:PAAR domain-containing protein [Polyangiaceae bacterium]